MPRIIAMWSGPRNISTAMMRSWEARGDTLVVDEPLYAHYLRATGLDHPGADDVIAAGETDLDAVIGQLTKPPDPPHEIFFQKHMAHHLLPGMAIDWVDGLTNVLLVREPREMLASLLRVLPNPDLAETGLPAQIMLMDRFDVTPTVVEARAVLEQPRETLDALCRALGVSFTSRMLSWPAGRRSTDGVWAEHWYANVERSTGFAPYRPKDAEIPRRHLGLLARCEALYEQLARHRLTP